MRFISEVWSVVVSSAHLILLAVVVASGVRFLVVYFSG